jgi:hypothetical protein
LGTNKENTKEYRRSHRNCETEKYSVEINEEGEQFAQRAAALGPFNTTYMTED